MPERPGFGSALARLVGGGFLTPPYVEAGGGAGAGSAARGGLARLVLRSAGLMPLIDPPALPPAPHLPALSPVLPPPLLRLALSCFSRFTIPESQLVYAVIPSRVRRQQ